METSKESNTPTQGALSEHRFQKDVIRGKVKGGVRQRMALKNRERTNSN